MMTEERLIAALRANRLPVIGDIFTDERGAAFLLGVNERTLRAWRRRGGAPPAARVGRWLYDLEALAAWLNAAAEGGSSRQEAAEAGAP